EAAQMRGDEEDARALGARRLDQFPALGAHRARHHLGRRPPPDEGQLERLAADLDDGRAQHRLVLATERVEEVLAQAASIGRRTLVGQPARPATEAVKPGKGQAGEEAKCALRQHQGEIRYGCRNRLQSRMLTQPRVPVYNRGSTAELTRQLAGRWDGRGAVRTKYC